MDGGVCAERSTRALRCGDQSPRLIPLSLDEVSRDDVQPLGSPERRPSLLKLSPRAARGRVHELRCEECAAIAQALDCFRVRPVRVKHREQVLERRFELARLRWLVAHSDDAPVKCSSRGRAGRAAAQFGGVLRLHDDLLRHVLGFAGW